MQIIWNSTQSVVLSSFAIYCNLLDTPGNNWEAIRCEVWLSGDHTTIRDYGKSVKNVEMILLET